jgi:hypothetical protein
VVLLSNANQANVILGIFFRRSMIAKEWLEELRKRENMLPVGFVGVSYLVNNRMNKK